MSATSDVNVLAPNGQLIALPLNSLAQTFTYTGSNVATISVTYNSAVYRQTFTYSGSNLTNISNFVWVP